MIISRFMKSAGLTQWALLAIGALVALALPWFIYPPVATDIIAWGLFAVALDLLLGYTGLLSFGHAAFWGVSAYTTGIISIHLGVPFYVSVLGGGLMAALIAIPIGYLSVRQSGIYFAMVTLAFAQLIYYLANQWRDVTGGENGLQGIPRNLFGLDLSDSLIFYYAALPVIALGVFMAWRIVNSPFGRVIVAIRENHDRTRSLGYGIRHYKIIVFVLSAFLAGIAGGIFSTNHGFASLQEVYWTTSGKVVVMVVLGGMGTLWGGLIGAGIVVQLEDFLATAGVDANGIVTGSIFILTVLLFRKGIWGTARALRRPRIRREPDDAVEDERVPSSGGGDASP